MKRAIPALCAISALLVGCDAAPSSEEAASTAAPEATTTATPTTQASAETTPSAEAAATTPAADPNHPLVQYADQLRGALPENVEVLADPDEDPKLVTVKIPHTLPNEEVEKALGIIQPMAVDAKQQRDVDTYVGDKVGSVIALTEAVQKESKVQDLKPDWDIAMRSAPILEGHFNYSRVQRINFIATDSRKHPGQVCADNFRNLIGSFDDKKLEIGQRDLTLFFNDCDGHFITVVGEPGSMGVKFENLANMLATPDLFPKGSDIRVEHDSLLVVEMPEDPAPGVPERLDQNWHQGNVAIGKKPS